MLKSWSIENFKAIVNSGELQLAPVTVLAGLNSSGKSSLLQSILMISQTLGNRVLDRPLLPNGPIVQLGTFEDILNYGTSSKYLTIMFTLNYKSEFSGICHTEEDFLSAAFEGSKADEITVCVKFSSLTKNLSNLANLNIIIERISLQVSPSIGVSVNQKTYDDFEMIIGPISQSALNVLLENVPLKSSPRFATKQPYIGTIKTQDNQNTETYVITSFTHFLPSQLQAVGVGVSQILPILVMGLLAPRNTLLIIEQPELHLHPRVQARLGDFFMGWY